MKAKLNPIAEPCALCGRTGIKRRSFTIGPGQHRQRKLVCGDCIKRSTYRRELDEKFSCLMPFRGGEEPEELKKQKEPESK